MEATRPFFLIFAKSTPQKQPSTGIECPRCEHGSMDTATSIKRLLLLQARDPGDPMIEHEITCFEGKFPRGYELDTHSVVTGPWEAEILEGYSAVLVGGSGDYGSANNQEPWFPHALSLLRTIIDLGLPLFCSCWGHQALAVALGGKVTVDPLGYELGVLPVQLTEAGKKDELFSMLPHPFVTPLGHCEQVVELPPKTVLLASTERCRVQSFRLRGKPVYGTQFHPELTCAQMWDRVDAYIPDLNDEEARSRPSHSDTDRLVTKFLEMHT